MKIKQFEAPDMRRAMRKVRDELGDDAVIISTRKAADNVEVLAALDYDPELASQLQANLAGSNRKEAATPRPQKARLQAISNDTIAKPQRPAADASTSASIDPQISSMQMELSRLRGLFEGELSELTWQEKGRRQPGRLALQGQLKKLGLSRRVCKDLLDRAPGANAAAENLTSVLKRLAGQIKVSDDDLLEQGGIVAVVGPTGVGKTTTVAKLAARFALRHGRNEVALITTDRFRVGAQEQLYNFGSILGVPVQAATSPTDLRKALASLSDRKLVLIDTAGMSQRDMGLTDQFVTLASADAQIKTFLVLSAIAQQQVLQEAIQAFSHIGLAGSIVTKIDEAASLGPIISALCRHQLPLAFIGNGQRVPEDMLPARRESLVEEAVRLARGDKLAASSGSVGGKHNA
ncbi:MAG: flagellar biosynthesis protein FlhF [Halieaceae bacterium]